VGGRRRSSCRWRRCGDLEAQGAQRSGEKREGTEGNPRGCLPWMGRGGRRPTTASHGGRLGPQGAAMPRRCGGDGEGLRRCSATRRSSWTRRLRLWRFERRNRVAAVFWLWPAAQCRRRREGGCARAAGQGFGREATTFYRAEVAAALACGSRERRAQGRPGLELGLVSSLGTPGGRR
jgi:hypothetical protein